MAGGSYNCRFSSYWNSDTDMTHPLILAKVPVKNPWEVFAHLPFGNWNECPDTPELMAVTKYWFEQCGAIPAAMTHDLLDFKRGAYDLLCQIEDRYACVKVTVTDRKPVRYDMGVLGNEDLDGDLEEEVYFSFTVDAGMGCILEAKTQEAFRKDWAQREDEEDGTDLYNDLFCDLLEENSRANPNTSGTAGTSSTGLCRAQTVTVPSLLSDGEIVCIPPISAMTQMVRCAASTFCSLMWSGRRKIK